MKPSGQLAAVPWSQDAAVRTLFDVLGPAGITARFVGGWVRDAVRGAPIRGEPDLAVDQPPETLMKVLEAARIKVVPTGLKHGTVTAVIVGRPFELTTLRRDVETDGRHAVVAYTDDWLEDASRRDFTFNALYADLDGTLYDPFDGRVDLAAAPEALADQAHGQVDQPAADDPSDDGRQQLDAEIHALRGDEIPDVLGVDGALIRAVTKMTARLCHGKSHPGRRLRAGRDFGHADLGFRIAAQKIAARAFWTGAGAVLA